jgi:hypothetical protein
MLKAPTGLSLTSANQIFVVKEPDDRRMRSGLQDAYRLMTMRYTLIELMFTAVGMRMFNEN